jgi:hypothetical protein
MTQEQDIAIIKDKCDFFVEGVRAFVVLHDRGLTRFLLLKNYCGIGESEFVFAE